MSSTRTMGVAVTDVSTAANKAQLPLGFEYTEPADATNDYGDRTWIYIEAAGALAEGEVVMRSDGTTTYKGLVTDGAIPSIRCLGVAQHTIASGSFGFVLKRGLGEIAVVDTGADQANDPLATAAGGRVDVMAAGEEHCVVAFATENAAATAGALLTAMIDCRG
jgi:hypothetical protein